MRKGNNQLSRIVPHGFLRLLFSFSLIVFVLLGVSFNGYPSSTHNWCPWDGYSTTVTTNYGEINGAYNTEGTAVVWKGVPFAKPPVGALRWNPPQDPDPWWGDTLDATGPCMQCTQIKTRADWIRTGPAVGGEDCLFLNIYRPDTCERNLPVYVFFHGGSNNFGKADDYDGSVIASKSNMVVVIAQYRLGPLGWFYHSALQDGDPLTDSGNFGTLDNIQALKWIHENIRAFGGNPRNVTITGESAGAHNVMNLVISPLAKGLFQRAMSESGGMTTDTVQQGETLADATIAAILEKDGRSDVPDGDNNGVIDDHDIDLYLRSKTAAEIFEDYFDKYKTLPTYDAYQDGYVIPGSVVATIRSGEYNKVPIILGANEYELKSFMPLFGPAYGLPWFDLIEVLKSVDDPNGKRLDEVLLTPGEKLLYQITGYYGSRNWRAKFVDERAKALREHQKNVYAYLFKWGTNSSIGSGPSPFDFIYGAGHAQEINFFFGEDTSLWGYGYNQDSDTLGRQALSDAMMKYLANFARTGNPNVACSRKWNKKDKSTLPVWKRWHNKAGKMKVMEFDADYVHAVLKMSNEEVTIPGVTADLTAAAAKLPEAFQSYPWYFQWYQAEPEPEQ